MTLESLSKIGRETPNIGKYLDLEDQLIEEEDYIDIKYKLNFPIEEQNKYFAMLELLIRKLFKDVEMQSYIFLMPESTLIQQNNITCYNISLEILTNYNIEINQKNIVNQTNNVENKIYNLVKEKNIEKTSKSYNQIKQEKKEQKTYSQSEKVNYTSEKQKSLKNKLQYHHKLPNSYSKISKQMNYQKAKNSYAKKPKKIEKINYHHKPKSYAKAKKVEKNNYQSKPKTYAALKKNYTKINKSNSSPNYQKQNLEKISRTNPSYQRNNKIQQSPIYSRGQINNKPALNYQRNLSPNYSSSRNTYSRSVPGYSGRSAFSPQSKMLSYGMKGRGKTAAKGSSK